jgi:hypothetical protein
LPLEYLDRDIVFLNFDLKLSPHKGLISTSLCAKSQNFWMQSLWYRHFSKSPCFPDINGKASRFWKMHISERLHLNVLEFCTQASLNETFMWPKFQTKIQKYRVIDKLVPTGKNSISRSRHAKGSLYLRVRNDLFSCMWVGFYGTSEFMRRSFEIFSYSIIRIFINFLVEVLYFHLIFAYYMSNKKSKVMIL